MPRGGDGGGGGGGGFPSCGGAWRAVAAMVVVVVVKVMLLYMCEAQFFFCWGADGFHSSGLIGVGHSRAAFFRLVDCSEGRLSKYGACGRQMLSF